jgi:hypothetical protein
MPGVSLDLHFAGRSVQVRSDAEGYYDLHLPGANVPDDEFWHTAEVRRSEGEPYAEELQRLYAFGLSPR